MTIPDELERALEAYRDDAEIPPGISAVMQAALREYLTGRGYLVRPREDSEVSGEDSRKPWPRYPLFDSGDPTFADRVDAELAGGRGENRSPPFGEH